MHLPLRHTLLRGFAAFVLFHFCTLSLWLGAQVTPQGAFSGNTICPGGQAQLTFTATLGTGPFSVRYSDGYAIRTQAGVTSGVPFNAVSNTTSTKTYTLLKVTGSDAGERSSGFTDATGTVTVNPRPDLQSLALAPLVPACPGSDAMLKLNGFAQAQGFDAQTPISTTADGARSTYAADLDGDGDLDVLSASHLDSKIAWYKNDGGGGFTAQTPISTSANFATSVYAADLDGDGYLDVLSASQNDNKIAWYKNNGSGGFTAQTPSISNSANNAQSVYAADLDGDGDMDVLSASFSDWKIAWYKNDGGGGFTAQTPISTSAPGAQSVHAADLDGDGDLDVLSASVVDKKIAWYKNDGSGAFTAQTPISITANGANSVYAADLDGDGDMDVLSASSNDNKIAWYKNDGGGGFTAQPLISITANGANSVYAADLDGDGDMDVLSASVLDNKIAWYKNNGGGGFTAQTPISTSANRAWSVHAADLDGDGDLDVLSASQDDDKIAWYKNRTPFGGSATVTYNINGGAPQTASGTVSMGMASLTIPAPSAGTLTVTKVANGDGCSATTDKATPVTSPATFTACPTNQSVNVEPNTCAAPVPYTAEASGTPAPALTYAFTGATTGSGNGTGSGASFNKGNTVVTVTANNGCNATCVFTVTVTDNAPPGITCAGPVTINTTAGLCTGMTTLINPTVTDNCSALFLKNAINSDGMDDYMTAPFSGTGLTQLSVEFWFNKGNTTNSGIFQWAGSVTSNSPWILLRDFGSSVTLYVNGDNRITSAALSVNTWYHVAITYNGSIWRMYINGVLSGSYTGGIGSNARTNVYFGNGYPTYWKGTIDEARIWNTARTQTQIQNNMTGELIGNEDNLVAYWRFNQGNAGGYNNGLTTATATVGPNGTLTNFALDGPISNWVGVGLGDISNNAPATYPKGSTTVLWTATDASGNTNTCQQTVTVLDNQAPTVTCPENTTVINTDAGASCQITIPDYAASLSPTDNCTSSVSIVEDQTPSAGAYPVSGDGSTVTVTYTATDGASPANTTTCTVTITVNAAEINVKGNGANILDGSTPPLLTDHTDFGSTTGAPITRTFTIENLGHAALSLAAGSITLTGTDAGLFSVWNVTLPATVNGPSGTITFDVTYTPVGAGTHVATVNIAANDCNESTYNFDIQGFRSCSAASFTACPTSPVEVNTDPNECNAVVNYDVTADGTPAPTLTYARGGEVTDSGNGTGDGLAFPLGTTMVTVTATNPCSAPTCTFNVVVTDAQKPTFTCPTLPTTVLNTTGGSNCQVVIPDLVALVTNAVDNCALKTTNPITQSVAAGNYNGVSDGMTIPVVVTVTDNASPANSTACTVTFTVNDDDAPTFTCPTPTLVLNTTGGSNCQVVIPDLVALVADEADNCALRAANSVEQSIAAGNYNGVSDGMTIPVTVTVTDNASPANSTACTITFTVNDDDAPTVTCPENTTVNTLTGNSCAINIPNYVAMLSPTDNCTASGSIVEAQSVPAGTYNTGVFHGAVITVNYTATDGASPANTVTCTVYVTVNAPEAEVRGNGLAISDGDNIPDLADHTNMGGATLGNPITRTFTVHNTGGLPLTVSSIGNSNPTYFTLGALTPPGPIAAGQSATFTVEFKALSLGNHTSTITVNTDDCNEGAYDFAVTGLVGCVPPSVTTCPGAQNVNVTAGQCGAAVNYTATFFANPAPDVSYAFTGATTGNGYGTGSGTTFNKGTTTVTLTASNSCGNTSCVFTVTVTDTQAPTVSCPPNQTVHTSSNGTGDCTGGYTLSDPMVENCPGGTWSATFSGNANGNPTNLTNRPDGGSAGPISFSKGITTVSLSASDAVGLTAAPCTFTVTVVDNELPGITCPANISRQTAPSSCGAAVSFATPTATDNCGGATATQTAGPNSGTVFPSGASTTVSFRAVDAGGLSTSCSFTVTVTDNQAPTIACSGNISRPADAGQCTALVSYATPTASDNCALPSGQPQWVSGGTGHATGSPNSSATFAKGITTVTWRATDAVGLTKTCTFRVIVSDTQAPSLTCPAAINVNTPANACSATVTYSAPTFTDNCAPTSGTAVRVSGLPSGSAFPVGTSNVVFQATDAAGLTRRCTLTVSVTDNQPPVIACPPSVTVAGAGTPCVQEVFYAQPTASDNCAGALTPFLVDGWASGSIYQVGVTTNTWRAVAPNGQSSECSFTVTVNCPGSRAIGATSRSAVLMNLAILPNPAKNAVYFTVQGMSDRSGELIVLDALGRVVLRQDLSEGDQTGQFDVSNWPSGLYRVSLRTSTAIITKALTVTRD